jgi:hypothetical protein
MEPDEAVYEAFERWGESAAVRRYRSSDSELFDVGYFEQKDGLLFFCALGTAATVEEAFTAANRKDQKPELSNPRTRFIVDESISTEETMHGHSE